MSIKENALIVSLSVGKPQLSKTDKTATTAAEQAVNAHGAGHYRKELYPKHLIAPITQVESSARAYIESTTYPWARGEWLLPTARFMQFAQRMSEFKTEFEQAVTAFLNNWVNVIHEAQKAQGDIFNASDYPDVSDLRNRFRFTINYRQVTDHNDFRVKLQDEELDTLRTQAEESVKAQMDDLLKEPLRRIREAVGRISDKLGEKDRVVEVNGHMELRAPIFRDTMIENLLAEVELLADFSDAMGSEYEPLLEKVSQVVVEPEKLRASSETRAQTKVQADSLLDAIDAMLED